MDERPWVAAGHALVVVGFAIVLGPTPAVLDGAGVGVVVAGFALSHVAGRVGEAVRERG